MDNKILASIDALAINYNFTPEDIATIPVTDKYKQKILLQQQTSIFVTPLEHTQFQLERQQQSLKYKQAKDTFKLNNPTLTPLELAFQFTSYYEEQQATELKLQKTLKQTLKLQA